MSGKVEAEKTRVWIDGIFKTGFWFDENKFYEIRGLFGLPGARFFWGGEEVGALDG